MTTPIKLNLTIVQGSTFRQVLRWESGTKIYIPITDIAKSAPIVITAPNHAIPLGWRAKVTNVGGMKEINSNDVYHIITDTTADTITINQINSLGYTTYTNGGVVEYNQPVNITNYTARMHIRTKLKSDDVIYSLTTENAGIEINDSDYTITIVIEDEITTDFEFSSAVYDLELINPGGEVTNLMGGVIVLEKEVTR